MLRYIPSLMFGLLIAASAVAQEPLRWEFEKGQTFFTEETVSLEQRITAKGETHETTPSRTTVIGFRVTDVQPDGAAALEMTIEDITGTGAGEAAEFAGRLEGATFQVGLDKDRQITRFEGYDEFIQRAAGGDEQQARVFRQILSAEALKASVGQLFTLLPGKAVPAGESWTQKVTVPLGPLGSVAVTRTLTHEGAETLDGTEAVKIPFTATATWQPAAEEGADVLPFKIGKADLIFKDMTGTAWFDPQAGRLLKSESRMTLDGTLTIQMGADQQDMKLEQEQTTRIRVLDEKPTVGEPAE